MNFIFYLTIILFYVLNIGLIILNLIEEHALPVLLHIMVILVFTLIFYCEYKK